MATFDTRDGRAKAWNRRGRIRSARANAGFRRGRYRRRTCRHGSRAFRAKGRRACGHRGARAASGRHPPPVHSPGFGLSHFKQELTGPEYAQRFIDQVHATGIALFLNSMVIGIDSGECASGADESAEDGVTHTVTLMSRDGMLQLTGRAVVLAMGCRERTRGEIKIPGSRPAGVFTAGLAQRYINIRISARLAQLS